MSFLNPSAFYLLTLIGLLLLLYFLKLKRQTHSVSSLIFWRQEIEDLKADTPFQRLRASALLLLQLLFLIFCISALARPFIKGVPLAHGKVVLILDTSASMSATDEKPTRLEAAISEAKKLIQRLKAEDQISLIAADNIPKIISNFSSNRNQLYQGLRAIFPTDSGANLKAAVALGISSLGQEAGTIIISSDSVEALTDLPAKAGVNILAQTFGKRSHNVAITAFDVRPGSDSKRYEVFVKLRNFYESEKNVDLSLHLGKNYELFDVKSVKLAPNSASHAYFVFDNIGYKMTPLKVQLDINDELKADNATYAILDSGQRLKILLVSQGNRFLEEALKSQTRMDIMKLSPSLYLDSKNYDNNDADYDVVIFDSFVPDKLPQLNALFINPNLTDLPFIKVISAGARHAVPLQNPAVIQINSSHPIMRFVELSDLKIAKSLVYERPSWGLTLLESENAPLIWIGENENRRSVFITFDLNHSDLPLKTAFPILISNILSWLSETKQSLSNRNLIVGSPIKIEGQRARQAASLQIIDPNGRQEEIKVQNGIAFSKETQIVGIYEVRSEGKTISRFAVNLLDERESNTKPALPAFGREIQESSSRFQDISRIVQLNAPTMQFSHKRKVGAPSGAPIHNFLLAISISILAIEWWICSRTNKGS